VIFSGLELLQYFHIIYPNYSKSLPNFKDSYLIKYKKNFRPPTCSLVEENTVLQIGSSFKQELIPHH
jgi:hypothetical protein